MTYLVTICTEIEIGVAPMLRSVNSLDGFKVAAADGHIGKVKDFYFDDEAWVIRDVVVDSGDMAGWP